MRSCTSCIHKCSRRHLPNILRTMPCHFLHHCHPGSHLLPSPLRSHKSLLTAGLLHPQSCSPVAPSPQWTLNELIKSSVRPHPPWVQNPNGFHFNLSKSPSSRTVFWASFELGLSTSLASSPKPLPPATLGHLGLLAAAQQDKGTPASGPLHV